MNKQILELNSVQAFHLLLSWSSGHPPFQEWLSGQMKMGPPGCSHIL